MARGMVFTVTKWVVIVLLALQLIGIVLDALGVTDQDFLTNRQKTVQWVRFALLFVFVGIGFLGAWREHSRFLWIFCAGIIASIILNYFGKNELYQSGISILVILASGFLAWSIDHD
ncbi:hypothetical protein HDE_04796 [Halotydeus destructor]|nr:hypothetical protein HDE_04796 [Halotydeus destructor]